MNAEMLRALRVVSVERGLDPRDFALLAFGGAGPLHACALAEELGMRTCSCRKRRRALGAGPRLGDERRDRARSYALAARATRASCRARRATADLRYRGQSFELEVPLTIATRAGAFHAAHEARYGYADRGARDRARRGARGRRRRRRRRSTRRRRIAARSCGAGVVELDGATCSLPAGWAGETSGSGTLVLARTLNVELPVLGSALGGIAEEMGAVLVRCAFSANVKERRDPRPPSSTRTAA